jgi:AcrR family transcriptional regulator
MASQRRSTEERQVEIADAALRILGDRGVTGMTVTAVAKEVGLTGGALYRHFPSTDAILEAVALRVTELLDAATPPATLAPRAWLLELANLRTATVGGHAGLSRLLLNEQLTLSLPPAAIETLAGAVKRTRDGIVRALEAGQTSGEFRADIPAQALVPIVLGTIQLIAIQRGGPKLSRLITDPMPVFLSLLQLLAPPRPNETAPHHERTVKP